MHKKYIITGAILGGLAVALGAFGAHGLKKLVDAETIQVFQTGTQYQMYHAIALLLTGILMDRFPQPHLKTAGIFFIVGIILFCGAMYTITAGHAAGITSLNKAGIIAPFGGLCFIAGWLFVALSLLKK